jgi:benzoylformate decarboxylase
MIIFDEALTDSPTVERYRPPTKPEHRFLTRGGSLRLGIPGVIGVKLANPDKPAIAFKA